MPEIKAEYLLMFSGFVLPGAISMYFYGLITPQKEMRLQERLLEAICFSILNFVVLYIPISDAMDPGYQNSNPVRAYLWMVACFVFAPVAWPFLLVRLLRFAESCGFIAVQAKTAWDDFFGRQSSKGGFWVQVVLNDGSTIGGKFGKDSFASAYPDPGHILIEEQWDVGPDGAFVAIRNGAPGVILRPTDYKFVKVFTKVSGGVNG